VGFVTNVPSELPPLTSLRFFAALMIATFHAERIFHWPWLKNIPPFLSTGVSFFFVLSGFILTHVYCRRRETTYLQFVWLRIARLWPVHAAMFIFVAALFPLRDDPFRTAAANLLLLQSYVPISAYYFSWDGASWSISTEFFFYLLFPFLLISLDRTWHWKLGAALAVSLSIILLVTWLDLPLVGGPLDVTQEAFVIPFPPMRLAEFCLGMAAYLAWSRWVQPTLGGVATWTALECLAVALTFLWLVGIERVGTETWIPALSVWISEVGAAPFFAIVIVALAAGRGLLGRLLSRRELVYLGAISFPLYLLHAPLMMVMQRFDAEAAPVIAALLLGSILLHEAIEKPTRSILAQAIRWDRPVEISVLRVSPSAKRR
jgi:peptidoglycan/LPS O-acetylase OafA/YrhL